MYKNKCDECGWVWSHEDDYCPNCGCESFEEFHLIECECSECENSYESI